MQMQGFWLMQNLFGTVILKPNSVVFTKTFGLEKFSREKRARGIEGICSLLHIEIGMVDIHDKDTIYWRVGESHSDADRDERTGKACDFIFWVAKVQHVSFQKKCVEVSGVIPLPSEIKMS
ncbi:10124_t:CDS:2 [Diversispora eburnea]|uniref:10124_t:CDS:1 n=1 Tax=Diversispora eburnea TaxID=1213867 RepID=A0A9N9CDH4_9GLOM|nr:10124_t:CDS:2 [Diversispora eburnea]